LESPLRLSSPFVDRPFLRRTSSAHAPFRRVHLKTITIAAQLNVSKRGASKGATRTIRRFTAQHVRLGCARSGEHCFHQRPTQEQSTQEARKGRGSKSNCRLSIRASRPSSSLFIPWFNSRRSKDPSRLRNCTISRHFRLRRVSLRLTIKLSARRGFIRIAMPF
jgi:hypothetical protein